MNKLSEGTVSVEQRELSGLGQWRGGDGRDSAPEVLAIAEDACVPPPR